MLNVGIIGAGAVVEGAHVKAYQGRDDVAVAAIADPVAANREKIGEALGCKRLFDDYRRVLDEPEVEVVDVCLPHFLHERVVLEALDAGKDVLLEKPISMTLEEADRMIDAAQAGGRQFYVALNQRFYPPHRKLKEIIDSGQYGRPFLALAQLVGDELARMNDPDSWKGSWDKGAGGALIDTGTHIIDLVLWWFGRPRAVSCQWGRFVVEADNKADDNIAVTLKYDAMLADVVVSYSCKTDPWRETKQVYFPDASIHITMAPEDPILLGKDRAPLVPLDIEPMPSWWDGSVVAGVNHFLDCFVGKAEPDYGPEAAREALEVILLAYRAAEEGRTLKLDST